MAVASRTMGGQRTEAEVRARGDDGRDQVPAAQDDAVWASAALTGADTGRDAEGVAEAADSLQDGPVRIIAVARSRRQRGGDELADLEARRAVAMRQGPSANDSSKVSTRPPRRSTSQPRRPSMVTVVGSSDGLNRRTVSAPPSRTTDETSAPVMASAVPRSSRCPPPRDRTTGIGAKASSAAA